MRAAVLALLTFALPAAGAGLLVASEFRWMGMGAL